MVTTVTNNSVQQINTSLFSLERDTDEKVRLLNQELNKANEAITKINKILDGINKDASVISVNGKTGIVTLDASDVGALPDSTVIPDAQVNSDWNATSGVAEILHKPNLSTVATSGSYNDLSNKPTIPTATSQLTNDSSFVTSSDLATSRQALTINDNNITNPDSLPTDGMRVYKVRSYNIGWSSNDGFIINIPWNDNYGFQIAVDDQSNWMAIRSMVNGTWLSWQRVQLES